MWATTLNDFGCCLYGAISSSFVQENNLSRLDISPKTVSTFNGKMNTSSAIACVHLDVGRHNQHGFHVYTSGLKRIWYHIRLTLGQRWSSSDWRPRRNSSLQRVEYHYSRRSRFVSRYTTSWSTRVRMVGEEQIKKGGGNLRYQYVGHSKGTRSKAS